MNLNLVNFPSLFNTNLSNANLANLAYLTTMVNTIPSIQTVASQTATQTQPATQTQSTSNVQTTTNNFIPEVRRVWPVPIINNSVYEYQNINKDVNLRKDVTEYYYNELSKWASTDRKYSYLNSFMNSKNVIDNKMKVYHLLRKLVKKTSLNWYDLRDRYSIVKEYLTNKLE